MATHTHTWEPHTYGKHTHNYGQSEWQWDVTGITRLTMKPYFFRFLSVKFSINLKQHVSQNTSQNASQTELGTIFVALVLQTRATTDVPRLYNTSTTTGTSGLRLHSLLWIIFGSSSCGYHLWLVFREGTPYSNLVTSTSWWHYKAAFVMAYKSCFVWQIRHWKCNSKLALLSPFWALIPIVSGKLEWHAQLDVPVAKEHSPPDKHADWENMTGRSNHRS